MDTGHSASLTVTALGCGSAPGVELVMWDKVAHAARNGELRRRGEGFDCPEDGNDGTEDFVPKRLPERSMAECMDFRGSRLLAAALSFYHC